MAEKDIKEVDRHDATVKKARRFDDRDWKLIAEYVDNEYDKRKRDRLDKEKMWTDIDRQVRMEPAVAYKVLPDGTLDSNKRWMAETEMPLQAQALEVLTADARRMMFAENDRWFAAHSQVTDEYLKDAEGPGGVKVLGDDNYVPSQINQDNADKLVEGYLNYLFRQYDHAGRFDIINSEAFKYGVGVGRARLERKNLWITEARGVRSEKKKCPVIVPCSIKNLYLEEQKPSFHSSTVLGRADILVDYIKYENIAIAANKGSTDPEDDDGGWMPKNFAKIVPDKKGYVKLLEMEGDIVVPRKTVKSIVIPGAIVTVAIGGTEIGTNKLTRAVIRFRFRKYPFSSYLLFPYLQESADEVYSSSPLMKGRTVQITATDAVNRFLDSSMLKIAPPVGYDRNDLSFAQTGGPNIQPYAVWGSADPVHVYSELGGDPTAMANAAMQFINLYAELTGILPARIGAQTKSHTTAAAKDAELQRGSVRTVDYVNSVGHGSLTNWLGMAYQMGRDALGSREDVQCFIKEYGGWVEFDKSMLPDASFEWFGSGGPQEKQQKSAMKMAAVKNAIEIDQLAAKMGKPPRLNLDAIVDEILREGGWNDITAIVNTQGPAKGPAPAPVVPGTPPGDSGTSVAALQNLSGLGGGPGQG